MFFNRKEHEPRRAPRRRRPRAPRRRAAVAALRAPRARVVVAVVVAAFVWLALILATYTRTDPGWSFSGTGAPIGNSGGVVGAWLSDLLLYLFGLSAWWWVVAGVVLVVAGYRRIGRPELATRPSAARSACSASRWCCCPARRSRRCGSTGLPATLPQAAGGALGELARREPCARPRLQRRDAAAARAVRRGLRRCSSACRGSS